MTYYTIPTSNDTQDLFAIFNYSNNVSGGVLMPLVLASIWFIIFIGGKLSGARSNVVFTFASFVCAVISILFVIMGFLRIGYMYLLIVMVAAGLLWIKLQDSFE